MDRLTDSTFISTRTARVSVRPNRCAYLVRQGSRADLLRAVTYAGTEWGGFSHPILPIDRRGKVAPAFLQIARELRPDYLVNYGEVGHDTFEKVAQTLGAEAIRTGDFDGAHSLGAVPDGALDGRTLIVPARPTNLIEACALGVTYRGQEALWRSAVGSVRPVASVLDLLDGQLDVPSIISATKSQIDVFEMSGPGVLIGGPVIVGFWRATVDRATWFWNLRALSLPEGWGPPTRVIWLPESAIDNADIWARIHAVCRGSNCRPQLTVISQTPDAIRSTALTVGFVESAATQWSVKFRGGSVDDDDMEPLQFVMRWDPRAWLFSHRLYGKVVRSQVTVAKPTTTVRCETPISWRKNFGGNVRVEIGGIPELVWPRKAVVARLLNPNATFTDEGLSFKRTSLDTSEFSLNLPDARAVVTALLGDRGWSWEVSAPGKYAIALDDLLGARLGALSSTVSVQVCRALARINKAKMTQIIDRVSAYPDTDQVRRQVADLLLAGHLRWRRLSELPGEIGRSSAEVLRALDELTDARVVSRGLAFRCPVCTMPSAIPWDRLADAVPCPGCRSVSTLTGDPGEEPKIVYSISSLLDRVLDQDCLSHLFAVRWVKANMGARWAIPGALLMSSAETANEVDVLAVTPEHLVIAEMKETHRAFTGAQLDKTHEVAAQIGATSIVLGAMDEWPSDRRSAAREHAEKWGLDVTILGRRDLLGEPT